MPLPEQTMEKLRLSHTSFALGQYMLGELRCN